MITTLLSAIGVFILLVVAHELGHFITAKLSGVRVLEFGVGFPPRIAAFKHGETEYSINALPLGGFVRMLGEEDPNHPDSLAAKPPLTRIIVLSAGAFMNFILAADVGAQLSNYLAYATPNDASLPLIDKEVREDPRVYPTEEQLAKMVMLEDVREATSLYDQVWTRVKAGE
jgi:regulator of sigma E protease